MRNGWFLNVTTTPTWYYNHNYKNIITLCPRLLTTKSTKMKRESRLGVITCERGNMISCFFSYWHETSLIAFQTSPPSFFLFSQYEKFQLPRCPLKKRMLRQRASIGSVMMGVGSCNFHNHKKFTLDWIVPR